VNSWSGRARPRPRPRPKARPKTRAANLPMVTGSVPRCIVSSGALGLAIREDSHP
jgi:hypothetical protein